jgi:enamine deaminase RidA (YjgF/YER057c/UK114 family)
MKKRIFRWLDREFVELYGEAQLGASVQAATAELFENFQRELAGCGLTLPNIVRTRLWATDKEARTRGTAARAKILTVSGKASSSSYVAPERFESNARVAVELLAMRPRNHAAERKPVDFEPPRNYLCYLRYDSIAFFSGFTSDADTLEQQVAQIRIALASALAVAGVPHMDWSKVVKLTLFLHRTQKLDRLKEILAEQNMLGVPELEFGFVDGYGGDKSLIEIEATALIGRS